MMPPSLVVTLQRWKPVAMSWSSVAFGSRSPASCSMVNWSNGRLRLNAADHPVAVRPHLAVVVEVYAVRVAVAGDIEPVARAVFAVVGRREVAVDHTLVGVGLRVLQEGLDFRGRRRQAGGIERDPANQSALAFDGGGDSPFSSSFARMKRSIGLRAHAAAAIATTGCFGLTGA